MKMGDSFHSGYAGQDNLTAATKPGIGVGNYRADTNLKVTSHHLSIGINGGLVAGCPNIGAIGKGIMIIDGESG
ncbi:hypothetical protein ES708_33656 [subsurface metagenome]